MKNSATGIVLVFFMIVISLSKTSAQQQQENAPPSSYYPPKKPFRERLFTGGYIGLQFGTITYVDVSPLIGYMLTEKLSAGVGGTYIYVNDKRYQPAYTSNSYGGRIFGQYRILESVIAYSEYELLNTDVYDDLHPNKLIRMNISSLLLGGGYVQSMGGRSSISLMALWNVIESHYSIYQNPVIRIGFNVGF